MPKYIRWGSDVTASGGDEQGRFRVTSVPDAHEEQLCHRAIKMKVYMQAQGVWDAIEPAAGAAMEVQKDKMALAAIYQGIPEETLLLIAEKKTVVAAWETLKTMHLGTDRVKSAKVQNLKTEFELLRMKKQIQLMSLHQS